MCVCMCVYILYYVHIQKITNKFTSTQLNVMLNRITA